MVSTSTGSPIDTLITKNSKMTKSANDTSRALPLTVVKSKVAVRYLLKRSRRISEDLAPILDSQNCEEDTGNSMTEEDDATRKQKLLARLRYLGLAPRKYSKSEECPSTSKRKRPSLKKREKPIDDAGFVRPFVFECDFCPKIFFNKILFRRHTIKHLTVRRCGNCNQPCATTIAHRRHQVNCKNRYW